MVYSGAALGNVDLGMEAWAAAAGHSDVLLSCLDLGMESYTTVYSGDALSGVDLGLEAGQSIGHGGGGEGSVSALWFCSLLDDCICNGILVNGVVVK